MFTSGPDYRDVEFPPNFDKGLANKLINTERLVFITKGLLSLISIGAGIWFTKLGITTQSTLKFSIKDGLEFEMNNAFPGIVFLVFGIILMVLSRKIKIKVS